VFNTVVREAKRRGCSVIGSEIIGLVPREAIELSAEYELQLENFTPAQVLENRLASVAGILLPPPAVSAEPMAALQPLVNTLRDAVQELSERVLDAPQESGPRSRASLEHGPEQTAESHLGAAFAAAEILERLVQLETIATSSMLLDWLVLKHSAIAAARASLDSAVELLPSLRDAGTIARIKSGKAEIEAKLSGKSVTAGN
jgi:hypothetical protein